MRKGVIVLLGWYASVAFTVWLLLTNGWPVPAALWATIGALTCLAVAAETE